MNIELTDDEYKKIAEHILKSVNVAAPVHDVLHERIRKSAGIMVTERLTELMLGISVEKVLRAELDSILEKQMNSSLKEFVFNYLKENPDLQQQIQSALVAEAREARKRELKALDDLDEPS